MFSSRQTNNIINKIHERGLRIALNDQVTNFETMFRNINDITSHHRNIETLMIELFKINGRTVCCNFRNLELQELQMEKKKTVFYGLETISYRAPQLRTLLSEEFKQKNTISLFKSNVRKRIRNECTCRMC